MTSATHKAVVDLADSHRVFLFVKSNCPHSRAAREALKAAKVNFQVKEIDTLPEKDMKEF
jgi:glutaredoxin